MSANDTNNTNKIIHPELSYLVTGVCFSVHNELGRYAREKQYGDAIEQKLDESRIPYKREVRIGDSGDIVDFFIDDKILIELKAVRFLLKEYYFQIQRYLQTSRLRLGLLINFRNRYLKPVRIVRIDKDQLIR